MQQFLSISDVAESLAVSERTISRLIAEGRLPAYRVRGSVRIRADDLAAVLQPISRHAVRGDVA